MFIHVGQFIEIKFQIQLHLSANILAHRNVPSFITMKNMTDTHFLLLPKSK